MGKIKYIIFASLIFLMASCAKDDEIQMGSLKINVNVTNVTSTMVLMEFDVPSDATPIDLYSLYIFDSDGEQVYVDNDGWNNLGPFIMNNKYCVVENLKPNTKYTYGIYVNERDKRSINSGNGGDILLSDPSYTFTTLDSGDTTSIVSAALTMNLLTPTTAEMQVSLNGDFKFYGSSSYNEAYLSESESGINPISYYYCSVQDDNKVTFYCRDLTPDTEYYFFLKSNVKYTYNVNGYEFNLTFDDVQVKLNPNSFKTPSVPDISATLTTLSLTPTSAKIKITLDDDLSFYGWSYYNAYLSEDESGTNPISLSYSNSEGDNVVMYTCSDLTPDTEYYFFMKSDVVYTYKFNDDEYNISFEDAEIKFNPNSFRTPSETEYAQTVRENFKLKEVFNSESYYIGYLEFENMTIGYGSKISISKDKGGINSIATESINSSQYNVMCIYSYNLEPSTEYFVSISQNVDLPERINIVDVASFTTKGSSELDISLDMTTSISKINDEYSLGFSFDQHLLLSSCRVETSDGLYCYMYSYDPGYVSGEIIDYDSNNIIGEHYITSFRSNDAYYITDEGYRCPFPFPLYYNPRFEITGSAYTQDSVNGEKVAISYYGTSDGTIIGYANKYY